jgi:hypothetical protein
MAIFQSSVLKKYLKQLDTDTVAKAYKKYTKYFHDAAIQQNIRESKEEQYQAKFLDELFVSIFGYTLNPQPKFNLTTEFKNIQNARKADGAILQNDAAIAVIELKGTNTKDLESIRKQAFDYKANQPECVYVITSNFEKLRFYINNAVDFEEFDLFALSYSRFELLYLCLHKDNLLQHVPLKIKESSIHEEEAITKTFYNDYSQFKRELFRDIVKRNLRNPELKELGESSSKKELFKKTQKLLDRFLFIFFGEDRGLLPPNSIPKILEQWESLKNMDAYVPLYERYKKYFGYLNDGWKGQQDEIFAYNGGLFKPDPILDTIQIDDDLLFKHTSILTKYDFESQVDVNILGHIFEHSLNEIESVNAEIDGVEFDKQKTKRKKDGVFYTPKYITKYIVDNTVGKLCEEKKAELNIHEEEYLKGPKNRAKTTIQKLDEQLEAYRAWLLTLTICDPACGSGAFLNQALDFLILEHRWVDELSSKLHGGGFVFPDIENSILEKNIYGVDLNDESVEIAKLSLWLRTAQKGRKLTSLNSNIKCGNSLIDSKAVAGDKAFSWEKEFPEVFENGGFDVVIGNPPYVRQELIQSPYKEWMIKNYSTGSGTVDLYVYFYEKSIDILKTNGLLGFITPNKFYKTKYGKELRVLLKSKELIEMIDFFELPVFQDASTDSQILILRNKQLDTIVKYCPIKNISSFLTEDYEEIFVKSSDLKEDIWVFNSGLDQYILQKMNQNSVTLGSYVKNEIYLGVKTAANEAFIIDKNTKERLVAENPNSQELIKKYVSATDIKRYHLENSSEYYLINTGFDIDVSKYSAIFNWLLQFDNQLRSRSDKGLHHFNLRACSYYNKFESPKLMYIYTAVNHNFKYDENGFYVNNSCFIIGNADKFLSAILNSKLFSFYKRLNFVAYGDAHTKGRVKLDHNKMKVVPIKVTDDSVKYNFERKVVYITKYSELHFEKTKVFTVFLTKTFNLGKLTAKLQSWHTLDFSDFIKELNKAIKTAGGNPLSKLDEMEWMELFETKKKEALELKAEIDRTDREIDEMVYELYGLTEEEILIVEQS